MKALNNYKTVESNKYMPIYEPYHIWPPNPYLKTVNYCCKQLHATYRRVPGFASDKRVRQLSEALLKYNLFY